MFLQAKTHTSFYTIIIQLFSDMSRENFVFCVFFSVLFFVFLENTQKQQKK